VKTEGGRQSFDVVTSTWRWFAIGRARAADPGPDDAAWHNGNSYVALLPLRRHIGGIAVALAITLAGTSPAAQSKTASLCDLQIPERVVAVGDVHGAYDRFVAILKSAALIDTRLRWSGGRAVLVQTGDILDRGSDSRKVLDLLRRLENEAARAGGRVITLLGNHEVMRMMSDWRYVSAGELGAFRTPASADVRERAYAILAAGAAQQAAAQQQAFDEALFRERFLAQVPLGYVEMRQAFAPTGDYGRWLRERPAVVRINGIVFVHGGISAETAALGCEATNDAVRGDLTVEAPTAEQQRAMLSSSETGPLWYRGLAEGRDPDITAEVTRILESIGARAIVIGHTVTANLRITARLNGRVIQIDTGMLGEPFYPGGTASALEIRGNAVTAIYERDRERLDVDALASGAVAR
jgi:hypothetical protein